MADETRQVTVSWYSAWAGRILFDKCDTPESAAEKVAILKRQTRTGVCQIRVDGKAV